MNPCLITESLRNRIAVVTEWLYHERDTKGFCKRDAAHNLAFVLEELEKYRLSDADVAKLGFKPEDLK